MGEHLFEIHTTNPLTFWGPNMISANVYIFSLMVAEKVLYALGAWFVIRYLNKFYGERLTPKEWKVFWWAFVIYSFHEVVEMIALYQWMHGELFWLILFSIEITSAVLITWGCYLLARTYVLKK